MPNVFTQVCQTIYEYASSTPTTIATSTEYCYHSLDIYFSIGVEALFFIVTVISLVWIFIPKKSKDTILLK